MWRVIKRLFVILPALILEFLTLYILWKWLSQWAALIEGLLRILGVVFVVFLVSARTEETYKVFWILFIMAVPLAGTMTYLLYGDKRTSRPIARKIQDSAKRINMPKDKHMELYKEMEKEDLRLAKTAEYISKQTRFPIEVNEDATYYPLGELMWKDMLEEMKKAEKYIYLEYFIIHDGEMWRAMRDIMEEKVKEGVDVRLIYDDFGSLTTFSDTDTNYLTKIGVKWICFNELKFISGTLNNRSHRKILIIDGKTAFSGGINLADEYINKIDIYGHWKDIGFRIKGRAVGNYVYMFMEFWNAYHKDRIDVEVLKEVPARSGKQDGLVLSYYDAPFNTDPISNNFFIEMLGNATNYAWFYTPYLILGDALMDAFERAAKRGVDIRIIMPGIPDKKIIFRLSRSYYKPLLDAGVKIYEYIPGFVHAKAAIFDDKVCSIGSVNLDYRSLFLHFENYSVFWNSSILEDLKKDFLNTQSECREVYSSEIKGYLLDSILRIFAPLC